MQHSSKLIISLLAACGLALAMGCQRSGDSTPPTASVPGPKTDPAVPALPSHVSATRSDQDPAHPVVEIVTTLGTLRVRLNGEKAPLTVDNFMNYVANRHFDQTIFHQVLRDYPKVVVGGGYTVDLVEKKTRTPIRNEAHNGLKNRRGTIAMARQPSNEDSATCQFFFNVADNEVLDHQKRTPANYGYCVFGEIIDGLDTLDHIAQTPVHDTAHFERTPVTVVAIKSIRQVR